MIQRERGEAFLVNDLKLIGKNNTRNCILAVMNLCSECKCFSNFKDLNVKQMCLKNEITRLLSKIRLLTNTDFDSYFINKEKSFIPPCFIGKKPEMKL